ncbi:hypothetical protein [Roseivivax sp. CAU 1753]
MALTPQQVKTISEAQKSKIEAQTQLWNLRLSAAVDSGNTASVLERIGASVADDINNCGCNVQCGALQEGLATTVNPGVVRR